MLTNDPDIIRFRISNPRKASKYSKLVTIIQGMKTRINFKWYMMKRVYPQIEVDLLFLVESKECFH